MRYAVSNLLKPSLSKSYLRRLVQCVSLCASLCLPSLNSHAATEEKPTAQEIRESVKQFLIRESNGLPGTVTVEVGAIDPRLNLASCAALETYLPAGSRLWGKVNVGVRCSAPTRWSIYVPSTVRVTGNYYVSAKPILQGQSLTEADIASVQGDLTSMSINVVTDPAQAVGHTSTMSLGTGIALRQDSLRMQQAVLQGQTIRLISNGDGFKVSTEAQALNSASEGQLVKVKIGSGQVLSGTAKLGGIVEVNN
jgi:flagella basal body P-ring formation protein FlgA